MKYVYNVSTIKVSSNYMDRWILSFTQSLITFVKKEMDGKFQLKFEILLVVLLLY